MECTAHVSGLDYALSRNWSTGVEYRFTDFGSARTSTLSGAGFWGGYSERHRLTQDEVSIRVRYLFAAPPKSTPPPPPPPAAFVAKDFVVYFPFDKYDLTPDAQTVIQQAAAYANDGHATQIVIVGHTDTSGSAAYNLRLSERRAKATADALVSLGVATSSMKVDWKGETDPAVATPNGVKEPLNRRTTININF